MGKTFHRKRDDWYDDENNRNRAQKFKKRRNNKLEKLHDHEKALTPPKEDDIEKEE